MRLPFALATVLTLFVSCAAAQQMGTRVCSTTTSGSISHEYCSFTPLVVQAPAVTVQPAQVRVEPKIEVILPKPAPPPPPEKPIKQ